MSDGEILVRIEDDGTAVISERHAFVPAEPNAYLRAFEEYVKAWDQYRPNVSLYGSLWKLDGVQTTEDKGEYQ